MNHKPLITYAGDIQVFQSVVPSLQKGIGSEAVEWKRAYGRTTKHVHLYPRFIPLDTTGTTSGQGSTNNQTGEDSSNVPKDPPVLTTLLDQPMLHTFWTDSPDVEVYRTTTKDTIQLWLNQVKSCNIRDWLIIVVEAPDNKKTKQLLPRSSVLDRIKNDFAQKQVERVVGLSDPSKLDSKTVESLHTMLHRLRQLVLSSYSKTLTKFEENMRAQREKRNEPGWNFCHYFLLQEELAFVLEMLEVYDEALVQYDELDALFTQFVLNSHLTDTPQWLLSFQRSNERWPALNLSINVIEMEQIRTHIRNSTVTLLVFRNYLFSRQASLLIKQNRVNELAQRSLGFLHNCINELSILDVSFMEEGATSCWVFASCLEILGTICGHGQKQNPVTINGSDTITKNETNNEENNIKTTTSDKNKSNKAAKSDFLNENMLASDFSVHTASLWDYAREKLYDLGKIGALLPKSQPRSDYLHKVISLAAGLTPDTETLNSATLNNTTNNNSCIKSIPSVGVTDSSDSSHVTPIERLKNALASKEQFEKNYLELCELAMGTYKHIGRFRSARKVGLSLADYYMDSEDYHKAIVFLTDALKTFRDDKWNMLVVKTLLKLAHCYSSCNDMERYIRTCCLLASCKELDFDRRLEFFDEMISKLVDSKPSHPILTSTEDSFVISSLKVETNGKIILNSCDVNISLELESLLPKPVECTAIKIAIIPTDPTHDHALQLAHQITTGNLSATSPIPPTTKGGKGNRRSSTGGEKNLKIGSGGRPKVERKESVNPLTCEDEDLSLNMCSENCLNNVQLELGQTFDTKQDRTIQGGRLLCHNPHQALRRKDSQVKSDSNIVKTDFSVSASSSKVILNPGKNLIPLTAKVTNPNSYRLGQISIILCDFEFVSPRMGCKYTFTVEAVPGTITLENENSSLHLIAGVEQIVTLSIATGSNGITQGMGLNVRASLGLQIKVHENSPLVSEAFLPLTETTPFSSIKVQLRVKSEFGPQKDNSLIEHKLMIKGPWSAEEYKIPIAFSPPFMSAYKLQTTKGNRKFLQVTLNGLMDTTFLMSNHQLVIQGNLAKDIPLVPLNPRSQIMCVTNGQMASYLWEIGVSSYDDETPIRLEFSATFTAKHKNIPPALYRYYFCPQKFKTMYEISYRIEPHKGTEFCRVGNMCTMIIEIMKQGKCKSEADNSLMYEVRADQHVWAICGRTSGVVSMDNSDLQQVNLDVMPMSPGFLPLPTVYLSKYIPADQKANSSVPKLDPFLPGQVYNKCKGLQIHVLPPPQGSCSTGTVGTGGSSSGSSSIVSGVLNEA